MPLILTHKILRLSVVVVLFFFLLKNNVWEIKITRKRKYEKNPSRSITKIKKQSNWLVQCIIPWCFHKGFIIIIWTFSFIVFCNLKKNCWIFSSFTLVRSQIAELMNITVGWISSYEEKKTTYNITNLNCSKLEAVKKCLHKKLRSGIWKIHFGTIFIK